MKIVRFEDIASWKEGRILCKMIYALTDKRKFKSDVGLKDQIQRAAVSVISNIAEGFDSRSNAEFQRFLIYARRSVSELKSQLYVAFDVSYITQDEFDTTYNQADKVGKLTNGFIRYLTSTTKPKLKSTGRPTNEQTNKPTN